MRVCILAGGSGTRLWPFSRTKYPKQFLKLVGHSSFLQKSVERVQPLTDKVYIITHPDAYHLVLEQLPHLAENILVEPAPKNTAFAISFAIQELLTKGADPKEVLFVSPADHLITPEGRFQEIVQQGVSLAKQGKIVTFGIRPTRPETGYGYIKADGSRFVEKPEIVLAQEFVASGEYFWNSGMFLFTLETMQEQFAKLAPQLERPLSIDYAIMEKSDKVVMLPMDVSWVDVGSWENLYDLLDKDQEGNVFRGEVVAHETKGSMILSEKRLVAALGLKDLVVVDTEDALLIASKKESQKLKEIVSKLQGRAETIEHSTVSRPWGSYTVLEEGERFKIKRITVKPLQKLSLQMHYHRSEHWVVVSGSAKVRIQDKELLVHEGESVFVPRSAIHRIENPGKVNVEIIEVQVGEYLQEDDIVRFEDIYGRLKQEEAFRLLVNG